MWRKMFPPYTKTFGGKIWKNLHSVSPDNFLDKKCKMVSLEISRQKLMWTSPRAKKIVSKTLILLPRKTFVSRGNQPNFYISSKYFSLQTLLHGMMLWMKTFHYRQFSFVTQDKPKTTKFSVLTSYFNCCTKNVEKANKVLE